MRKPWLKAVLRKHIVIHLRDDISVDGTLMETTKDGIILRAARLLTSDNQPATMAGEVWIPRENVAFAQLDD